MIDFRSLQTGVAGPPFLSQKSGEGEPLSWGRGQGEGELNQIYFSSVLSVSSCKEIRVYRCPSVVKKNHFCQTNPISYVFSVSPVLKPAQPWLFTATTAYYRLMTPNTPFFSGKKDCLFLAAPKPCEGLPRFTWRVGFAIHYSSCQPTPAFASQSQLPLPPPRVRINANQGEPSSVKVSQGWSSVFGPPGGHRHSGSGPTKPKSTFITFQVAPRPKYKLNTNRNQPKMNLPSGHPPNVLCLSAGLELETPDGFVNHGSFPGLPAWHTHYENDIVESF
jgi:hypothetical protein